MERIVEEVKKIVDGLHEGIIVEVKERKLPYQYIDFVVGFEGLQLKVGYADKVTAETKLGKLLVRFGESLSVGKKVNMENLIGRRCTFMTVTDGQYANILPDTLKPLVAVSEEQVN